MVIMTHTQKHKFKDQSVQKIKWKQTNGQTYRRTDRRTRPIALTYRLTQTVKIIDLWQLAEVKSKVYKISRVQELMVFEILANLWKQIARSINAIFRRI